MGGERNFSRHHFHPHDRARGRAPSPRLHELGSETPDFTLREGASLETTKSTVPPGADVEWFKIRAQSNAVTKHARTHIGNFSGQPDALKVAFWRLASVTYRASPGL